MLRKLLLTGCLLAALLGVTPLAAQENTPEPTGEPTAEVTIEATPEATAEATLPPGTYTGFPGAGSYTVRQSDQTPERTYRVYIPTSYTDEGDPVAMVIVMHGAGGTGAGTESFTGFDDLAERENFVAVYPDGVNNVWNDGRIGDPRVGDIDDVRFLDSVVQFMESALHIDPQRVYAAGYSMGGMMAYRLGCELPDRFAAVASVASTMPVYLISACTATAPIPVIVFQGTDDPVVPWTGVQNGYLSAAQTIGFWGNHNHCSGDFALENLRDTVPDDYTRVLRQRLNGCAADVVLYGIYFGGHTWPGHPINAAFPLGQTTRDIDATAVMWDFFKQHAGETEQQ